MNNFLQTSRTTYLLAAIALITTSLHTFSDREKWGGIGAVTAFGLGVWWYKSYSATSAQNRLDAQQEQLRTLAGKYATANYSESDLEQLFIRQDGLHAATPSIEQQLAVMRTDLQQIQSASRALDQERQSWNGHSNYNHSQAARIIEQSKTIEATLAKLEQALAQGIAPIKLRILCNELQNTFGSLIKVMDTQKKLDEMIRQQSPQQLYPHLEWYNRTQISLQQLDGQREQLSVEKPVARDAVAMSGNLQKLMNRIVNSSKYSEQQRNRANDDELRKQTEAQAALVRLEKERAQTEAQRLFVEQTKLRELQKANDLKEQEHKLQREQLAAAAINAVAHSSCNQRISQLQQESQQSLQELARQRQQLMQQRDQLNSWQATIQSLRDELAKAPNKKKLETQIAKLEQAIYQPGFNTAAAETPNDEPGERGEVARWHDKLKVEVDQMRQAISGQQR